MSKEAMKLALARLQARADTVDLDAIAALNEALAEQPAQRKPLSVPELEVMWNAQADHMNQWDELGLDEIVAFAQAAHNIKEKNT
jgi:hypothetical protein